MVDTNNIEDKIFSEKNGNFQTMNMIYKIKKIKKKKRVDNPKKIPFPEVLTNIKNDEPVFDKKVSTKEGFGFKDDDWEGYDTVKDKFEDIGGKDPKQVLIDFINKVYDSTVKYNKKLAKTITNKISKTEVAKEAGTKVKDEISKFNKSLGGKELSKKYNQGDENADEKRVYNYLCVLEALIFSSFVVNNWYFLMYYNKGDDGVDKFELFDFSVDKIKRLSNDFLSNKILKYIVLYFIEYALIFPTALEYFLINIFPNYSAKFFNHTFCYIVLFFIIFFVSYNFAWGLKQFLIDVINFNIFKFKGKKNIVPLLMFIAVVILYLIPDTTSYSGIFAPKDTKDREKNIMEKDFADIKSRLEYIAKLQDEGKKVDPSYLRVLNNKQKLSNDYAERINKNYTGGAPGLQETAGGMMSVLKLIWNVIRFMIIITISVPLGGIFCGIYFIFYSLYAMFYYCNMDFNKTYEIFTDMLKFLDNHKVEFNKNAAEEQTFFEQLMQRFNEYFEYMSDNFFILVYLFTFVYLITDTQKKITNTTLRNTLYITELSIIFSIVGYLIYVIRSKYKVNSIHELAQILKNNTPIEKDYGLSADMFNVANMGVYGVTIIGLLRIGFPIIKTLLFT
jgi:hypothetical protein